MNYIIDINKWSEDFINKICKKDTFSHHELENLKTAYITLRTKYKKETIDELTKNYLIENNEVINYFKGKDITRREIQDLFNFVDSAHDMLNSSELRDAVTDSFQTGDISQIKDFKIKKLYETGILDFVEFKKFFKSDVAFCEVKEALGWFIAYIESGDYNIKDIISLNEQGEVDRKSTLINIMQDINNKSLTNVPPFNMENGVLKFIPATSSEIDVIMWNENEQKIVGMSATRDRTTQIEGNQFIRHNMQINAWASLFEEYKNQKRIPSEFKLTTSDIKKIMHDYGWQNKMSAKSILKINDLDSDVRLSIESHNLAFGRHLSLVREKIKAKTGINFHENGCYITKEEISAISKEFKDKAKYYFFGEVHAKSQLPELNAGLLKRAYAGNFSNIMSFKMDKHASMVFMDSLENRFNDVGIDNKIDYYAQIALFNYMTADSSNFKMFADFFSEGSVYKEERSMLYKSSSLFLESLNELKSLDEDNIRNVIEEDFGLLNSNQKDTIFNTIKDFSIFEHLENNTKSIRKAPSEVNNQLESMNAQLSAVKNKLELFEEKQKNAILLDFLESKGIKIDPNDLEMFKNLQQNEKTKNNNIKNKL